MQKPLPVPIHTLGISQIIAYGFMFYVFAQIKVPLAEMLGVTPADILIGLTIALLIQAGIAPIVGAWVDYYGALRVMAVGLITGAVSIVIMAFSSVYWGFLLAMMLLGVGFSMSCYEVAFSAAVQMNEPSARRNISLITFYGGVASTLTWLSVAPLLSRFGLFHSLILMALLLVVMAVWIGRMGLGMAMPGRMAPDTPAIPFRWTELTRNEKVALMTLASASCLEYMSFAGITLMLIHWYFERFADLGLAVILASVYGPFQVVGRVLEMRFGARHDARITAMLAFAMVPAALVLIQFSSLPLVVLGMAMFGMGHGVLTVSFGFITNMYFRAAVYGRAKGWITTPRAIGMAIGPS
ncbi:MAG: MFS transporter, partial [Alphaproteobacteria bacterium]|nr:MFS transporter [Alphaproteobacteria bacterium]